MISEFQFKLRRYLTWYLNPKVELDNYVRQVEPYLIDQTGELISTSYKQCATNAASTREKSLVEIPAVNWVEYKEIDKFYLDPLVQLDNLVNSKMADYVSQFILHGSIATKDYIKGWSDVDTLVVVKKDTLESASRLNEFRDLCLKADKYLSLVDPLKHHGLIYCAEHDLENYASNIMPIEVLQNAVSLLRNNRVFSCRLAENNYDSRLMFSNRVKVFKEASKTGIFKHHMKDGKYLTSRLPKNNDVLYQLKYFLGLIMTMPSYYLEAIGTPCYKADSFQNVKEKISQKAWCMMDKSSFIRQQWESKEKHPYTEGNKVPAWVIDTLGSDYFQEAELLMVEMEELL